MLLVIHTDRWMIILPVGGFVLQTWLVVRHFFRSGSLEAEGFMFMGLYLLWSYAVWVGSRPKAAAIPGIPAVTFKRTYAGDAPPFATHPEQLESPAIEAVILLARNEGHFDLANYLSEQVHSADAGYPFMFFRGIRYE